jgi:hypothetical protein
VTVGGERDKVKPNGKNWLNSYGNRLGVPDHYLPSAGRRESGCDQVSRRRGQVARARRTIVSSWRRLADVM